MSRGIERVRAALAELGVETEITKYPRSTRTAEDAANTIGVPLGSIVKSLLFLVAGKPVLVLMAGDRRVDTAKLAALYGVGKKRVRIADAETVRRITGFAIGGVPPVGHVTSLPVLIDESLSRFEVVHAAAGSPRANFPIRYEKLVEVTGGWVVDLSEE
jgi:Cys-tRNA(Pro) deacylase